MKATEGEKTELTNKATQRHDAMEESATNFHNPEEVATTSTEEGRKVSWPDPEINKRYEEWKKAMNASNENTGATNYELAGKTQEMMPRRQALDHRRGEMNTSTETTKAASTNLPSTIQKTQTERSTISRQTKRSLPTEVSTNANTNKLSVTDNENTSPSRHLLGVATPFVLAPFVLLGILGYAWWNNSFSSIP